MTSLEKAIDIALRTHLGQTDKGGLCYILHPLKIMLQMSTESEQIVAVLHDVVEDGNVTFDDLRTAGFDESIVAAVDALTRRSGESYQDFVARAAQDPIARPVKIVDIRENLDVTRLPSLSDADLQRVRKYHDALHYLTQFDRTQLENATTHSRPC